MTLTDPDIRDEDLLAERLKAGDGAAFEAMVRGHGPRMLAVIKRYLPEESDAADALQDAFLSAFKAIGTFEGGSRLGTWLHRIAVNAALMRLRTARRRPACSMEELMPRFDDTGHHEMPIATWQEPDDGGPQRAERLRLVRECIERLPDAFREIIIMRDVEGLDTTATAEALGMTEAAVKTRLHRARQALRTLLDPHMRAD